MSAGPLVSVVVPVFNGSLYLRDALESVFAQTWCEREVIVVDDGSSDASNAIARQFDHGSVSRVLMVDVGTGLGALSVAAVASPLLIGEDVSEARQRAWVASTMGGAVLGGAMAWWITADSSPKAHASNPFRYGRPEAGVIAVSRARNGTSAPAFGIGWSGIF